MNLESVILQYLQQLLRAVEAGTVNSFDGICAAIPYIDQKARRLFRDTAPNVYREWEHFSGDLNYPVAHPGPELTAEAAWWACNNLWEGEYGQRRIELLKLLINYYGGLEFYLLSSVIVLAYLILRIYPLYVAEGKPRLYKRSAVLAALAVVFSPVILVLIIAYECFVFYDMIYRGNFHD